MIKQQQQNNNNIYSRITWYFLNQYLSHFQRVITFHLVFKKEFQELSLCVEGKHWRSKGFTIIV